MEHVVGATLVVFGIYVLWSLAARRGDFRMRSRWMLLLGWLRRRCRARGEVVVVEHEHEHAASHEHGHVHVHAHVTVGGGDGHRHSHRHRHVASMPEDPFTTYTRRTVFGVGMLHGIGGETPTQVLIFVTAAGVGGRGAGTALLVAFLAGLLVSNTTVALAGTYGFLHAAKSGRLYLAVAVVTASFSLAVGLLFLLGDAPVLPALFGG
jgi:high-affinity nickel-transport protein